MGSLYNILFFSAIIFEFYKIYRPLQFTWLEFFVDFFYVLNENVAKWSISGSSSSLHLLILMECLGILKNIIINVLLEFVTSLADFDGVSRNFAKYHHQRVVYMTKIFFKYLELTIHLCIIAVELSVER